MAAPRGNQFWKQRSKHGRNTLFANAEALWEAAREYFEWCDNNPWLKAEAIKSGDMAGEIMKVPTARPYSLSGLLLYCGANETFWRQFKATDAGKSEDFSSIITHIEEVINTQQFEGASVGAFNANIIARKLGLSDKQDVTTDGKPITTTITARIVRPTDDDD